MLTEKRIDVTTIGKYYYPFSGGIEEDCKMAAEAIAKTANVTVICNNHEAGNRIDDINGVRVIRTNTIARIKSQPVGIRTFWETFRAKADVIHFHAPNPLLSLALSLNLLFSRRRTPLVITHHMEMYGRPLLRAGARILYNGLLRRSAVVIAHSQKNVDCSDDIKVPCTVEAIPIGLDLDRYIVTDEQVRSAKAWAHDLSGGRPVVGFVGRHARYKGLDILVRAIAADPGLFAIIAGDGPQREQVDALVDELGIRDRILLPGQISFEEKLRLLSGIDVFAFPSTEITEAFGISQLEAMAVGAPLVASDLPTGVSDVSVNGETAITVPPGDPAALGAAIRRMLEDAPLRERLVATAGAAMQTRFNNEFIAKKTADVILSVARTHANHQTGKAAD